MATPDLSDKQKVIDFYENRYSRGYMGFWSDFEKRRLFGLVRELDLPKTGKALDFGCGRGIFTSVLKDALPGWEISGCDISSQAVADASAQHPDIQFFVPGRHNTPKARFDFIYSHHVIEHTFDEKITTREMCSFAAGHCVMMHFLPCANPGSFEHLISTRMKNGLDEKTGKFFFEDAAHLRRLNTEQAATLFQHEGFYVWKDYYANQHIGTVKWIAESNIGKVLLMTDPLKAKDFSSAAFFIFFRIKMLFLWFCWFVASAFERADHGNLYVLKRILQAIFFIPFFWLAIPVRSMLIRAAEREWKERRTEKNGAELILILKR